jgi:hypothetical protein
MSVLYQRQSPVELNYNFTCCVKLVRCPSVCPGRIMSQEMTTVTYAIGVENGLAPDPV